MDELTDRQRAILRKLQRGGEITWYWSRHTTKYAGLPRGATREDVWALKRAGLATDTPFGHLKLIGAGIPNERD